MSHPGNEQRPRTRGDCKDGPRPCPWVSCRHHLLLEIAKHGPKTDDAGNPRDSRPTTIRLNRAPDSGVLGRRPGLNANAPAELVRAWIRDAVEHLDAMEYTCALDVADAHPDGVSLVDVAEILGVTTAAIKEEVGPSGGKLKQGLAEYRDHTPHDHRSALARCQDNAINGGRR